MSIQQITLGNAPFLGQPGCAFSALTLQAIANGARYILPPGSWYVIGQTNYNLQFQTGSGSWTTVDVTFPAANIAGYVWSDGSNVAILNNSGSDGTSTLIQVR